MKRETCVLIAEAARLVAERLIDGTTWPSQRLTHGTCIYTRATEMYVV